jgi:hypothetical protein
MLPVPHAPKHPCLDTSVLHVRRTAMAFGISEAA